MLTCNFLWLGYICTYEQGEPSTLVIFSGDKESGIVGELLGRHELRSSSE